MSALLSPRLVEVLRAAHEVYFPDGAPDPVARLEDIFADQKRELRRFLIMALWAVELGPLPYRFSRFSQLSLADRTAWVTRLSRSKGSIARGIYALLKVLLQSLAYDAAPATH